MAVVVSHCWTQPISRGASRGVYEDCGQLTPRSRRAWRIDRTLQRIWRCDRATHSEESVTIGGSASNHADSEARLLDVVWKSASLLPHSRKSPGPPSSGV